MRTCLAVVAIAALNVASGVVYADESKVPLSEVPKAGVDAAKALFPGAEIVGASKETEDGKTVYEVSFKLKGRNIDVTVGTDGKIHLIEKEIAERDLPKPVQQTLKAKYPKATSRMVEEVSSMKDGKLTLDFFETLLVTADNRTLEVQITPDGKVKNEEKKQADND